jgi:beta-1,4-mannosyl-glycoprotein beta-1,4-N-acetylglucosaminyltransferase
MNNIGLVVIVSLVVIIVILLVVLFTYNCVNSTEKFGNTVKFIDVSIVNDEMDMLLMRLNEYDDFTDKFVIVESPYTFSGIKKPMIVTENINGALKKFKDKIEIVVFDPVKDKVNKGWDSELATREAGIKALNKLNLGDNDIVSISDIDEIYDHTVIKKLKQSTLDHIIHPVMRMFYYNSMCEFDKPWSRKYLFVAPYKVFKNYKHNDIKNMDKKNIPIKRQQKMGWHLSYFTSVERIQKKLRSFSHSNDKKIVEIKDKPKLIQHRMDQCIDLFDRNNPHGMPVKNPSRHLPRHIKTVSKV